RRVVTRVSRATWSRVFGISPDGKFLVMEAARIDNLNVIRASDGRSVRQIALPSKIAASATVAWNHLAGFSPDAKTAYAIALDQIHGKTFIIACMLESGEARVLCELDAQKYGGNNGPSFVAGRFFLVLGDPPRRVVEIVDSTQPSKTSPGM